MLSLHIITLRGTTDPGCPVAQSRVKAVHASENGMVRVEVDRCRKATSPRSLYTTDLIAFVLFLFLRIDRHSKEASLELEICIFRVVCMAGCT